MTARTAGSRQDKIAQLEKEQAAASAAAAALREEERIEVIRKAIAAGTYRVSSEALAEQLMETMRVR